MDRGFFEIGICAGKFPQNLGTLWRTASQLGAAGIFTIGHRYSRQSSDTPHVARHIPLRQYVGWDEFVSAAPEKTLLVAVEMGGRNLPTFIHPERAIYILGAEDTGLPEDVLRSCSHVVSLPSVGHNSYNVAIAGALVMYDRNIKRNVFGKGA